jgi:hypothetical protein
LDTLSVYLFWIDIKQIKLVEINSTIKNQE